MWKPTFEQEKIVRSISLFLRTVASENVSLISSVLTAEADFLSCTNVPESIATLKMCLKGVRSYIDNNIEALDKITKSIE